MPSGGFKLLDTAEVKMSFGGYSMFLGNNPLATTNGGGGYSSANNSWLARTFSGKDNGPCLALRVNEAKQTDRSTFNTNCICAVALCTPTQVAPSAPTNSSSSSSNNNNNDNNIQDKNNTNQKQSDADSSSPTSSSSSSPPKFDPEIIAAARTHRLNKDQSAIGEVYSLNPPQNQNQQNSNATTTSSSSSAMCARVRDVETLVLRTPAVAVVGLYNNIATLFALVDPACAHPKSSSEFQNGISDSEKIISLQSIRFAARCTAFTTFTTHVDFAVAHGLGPRPMTNNNEENNNNNNNNNDGPFQPYSELWSVFGFGSGDIIIWSHAQEAMLKRHNDSGILTKNNNNNNNNNNINSNRIPNYVEPGVAVSAIARVDRGLTERPTCMKWSTATASSINTQVTCFCDLVVGYENGTVLVISLNATGGSVNQNLSGWFGFSAIRAIRACPIAPYLVGVGFDDGSLKFLAFPWSLDAGGFEKELSSKLASNNNNGNSNSNNTDDVIPDDLNATDIGTSKDPRVLCSVSSAVSGGSVTCISWEANGEAVVCTGDDDAVTIISIQITPSLQSLRGESEGNNNNNNKQQSFFGLLPQTVAFLSSNGNNNVSASGRLINNNIGGGGSSSSTTTTNQSSSSLGVVRQQNNNNFNSSSNSSSPSSYPSSPHHQHQQQNSSLPFSLQRPLDIRPTAIHRRNFHRSWICGSMILSLDVHNINPRTEQPELRTVTAVYTAALDGAVVAGAAFPATQILSSSKNSSSSPHNKNSKNNNGKRHQQQQVGATAMIRHNSIIPPDNNNNNNNFSSTTTTSISNGLAIRNRPLARFLQMARNDTVLNFASIGDYNPQSCACFGYCSNNNNNNNNNNITTTPGSDDGNLSKQRKRSFVTITAKGTVAVWIFYDIAIEDEEEIVKQN